MNINEFEVLLDAKLESIKQAIDDLKEKKSCGLTLDETQSVKEMVTFKKRSIWLFMTVASAITIWILKDIYVWIMAHIKFN